MGRVIVLCVVRVVAVLVATRVVRMTAEVNRVVPWLVMDCGHKGGVGSGESVDGVVGGGDGGGVVMSPLVAPVVFVAVAIRSLSVVVLRQ